MEIDITSFVKAHSGNLYIFSSSEARSGKGVGPRTWAAAKAEAANPPALCEDLDALRAHFREFGAWDAEELAAMDSVELNAMLIQCVSADVQEYMDAKETGRAAFKRWYENFGGRVTRSRNGRKWYYYIGL